jgi:5-methylcytosine-specific restriction endonuclease McrA
MNQQALSEQLPEAAPEGRFAQQLPGAASGDQSRKWRRGDVGPDGRIFWAWAKASPNGQYWASPETFARLLAKSRAATKTVNEADRKNGWARIRRWREANPAKVKATVAKSMTPEAREKARKNTREWRSRNPDKCRQYGQRAYEKIKQRPERLVMRMLRIRLNGAVRRGRVAHYSRAADRDGVKFLLWAASRMGVEIGTGAWHVDHLVPLAKFGRGNANAPENVRWLTAAQNLAKGASLPTSEEVDAHLALVAEWKKETQSH